MKNFIVRLNDDKKTKYIVLDKIDRKVVLYQNKEGDVQEKYYQGYYLMAEIPTLPVPLDKDTTVLSYVSEQELVEDFTFVKVLE